MENFRERQTEETIYAGYRIAKFSITNIALLKEVASILEPYKETIVHNWLDLQFGAWIPSAFSKKQIEELFSNLFYNMLENLKKGELEKSIKEFGKVGATLAEKDFPYEALIISLHFLEESYMHYLNIKNSRKALDWFISMDEFLHSVLASIATSYFKVYRQDLLEQADIGRIVQEALSPTMPDSLFDLEIASVYQPAGDQVKVGGDLIDSFLTGNNEAVFIIGDVTGHGIKVLREMTYLRSLFRGIMREEQDIAQAFSRINNMLNEELRIGEFATVLAVKYKGDGLIEAANAGHLPFVICEEECNLLVLDGPALNIDKNSKFSFSKIELKPGALLVAFTDGLTEVRNNNEFFGEQRVLETVKRFQKTSAQSIANGLLNDALSFSESNILKDDIAILVLKRV